MSDKYNYCHIAELTDVGCKRAANEDWLTHFESPNGLVAVVCDGMGGHVGGQIASHTAIDAITQYMMQERKGDTPAQLITDAINAGNQAILNRAAQQPELTGMGATCVMLIVRDGLVFIGSVGDSRVYLIRNHTIKQLTKDQSYVQMLVDAGTLTAEQAEHHPRKNEITNALGLPSMEPATVLPSPIKPQAGDCFMLCSDGLSGMVSDKDICKVVSRQSEMSQQERVNELVERARINGGVDNITCQIVEFSITPGGDPEEIIEKKRKKRQLVTAILGIAAIVAALTIITLMFFNKKKNVHSPEITTLFETTDTIVNMKSVPFIDGSRFMEIAENRDFGGVTIVENAADNYKVVIKQPLTVRDMEIKPANCVKITYTDVDSSQCYLEFCSDLGEDDNEIAIVLSDKNGKNKHGFSIPLIRLTPDVPLEDETAPEKGLDRIWDRLLPVHISKKNPNGGNAHKAKETPPDEGALENVETETDKEQPLEYKVLVNKDEYVIILNGEGGDKNIKIGDYAFPDVYMQSKEFDRYSISCNGATCKITILKRPKDSFPIHVKTQPERGVRLKIMNGKQ